MPAILLRIISLLARFRRDTQANIAVTFALALLPIMTGVGFAIDYSVAIQVKAKLGSAADAASVAAVSQQSAGYTAAIAMTANGAVPAGVTEASAIFNGNVSNILGVANLAVTPVVTKSGSTLTATVNYSADVPAMFLGLIGRPKMTVSGTSVSTATLPLYLDFYVMLDVSGSMGLPSTNSEQSRLAAVNPDNFTQYPNGCVFACHFSSAGACSILTEKYPTLGFCQGYAVTRVGYTSLLALLAQNAGKLPSTLVSTLFPVTSCSTPGTDACIQLRADAVGYAVQQLLITANNSEKITNQFRIGLYPFIRYLNSLYAPLTANINGSASIPGTINYAAANLASQLDTGVNLALGSGGTHFENALPAMNTLIASVGDGTASTKPFPYVFLITDGAQNNQTYTLGAWSGSNSATTLDPTLCTTMKNRGVIISVLYIPYQPIQNPTTFANSEDFYANANIPYISPALQSCASPGFFYTANAPSDITAALNAMFNHALVTAHITN